ncbi:MAG TPA: hypothetical protein VGN15_14465 [Ktedonobacteraceae bacterium]|jgi:hypothetical protein|nr:hypothetical protein [Ktedonobacteraceae bacterium]
MATLYVTEFGAAGIAGNFPIGVAQQLPTAEQTVAISGASAQSAVFNTNTTLVRLHTDAICSVEFGANPTAAATKMRMAANQTEYFSVPRGSNFKVAVITNT